MKNLLIALCFTALAAATFVNQLTCANKSRAANRELIAHLRSAESALESATTALRDAERLLAARRVSLESTRRDLAVASEAARAVIEPPDISRDGAWPSNRNFFYLPKAFLADLGYGVFHIDGRLDDNTAQLFGMSPAERLATSEVWRDFRAALDDLQSKNAQLLDAPVGTNTENHREISFRVPALTNEIATLTQKLQHDLGLALGSSRSSLIAEKLLSQSPLDGYPMGPIDKIITYYADRSDDGSVRHSLRFVASPSNGATYRIPVEFTHALASNEGMVNTADDGTRNMTARGVGFPLSPSSQLWNYRHLFGDRPLLPPKTSSAQ